MARPRKDNGGQAAQAVAEPIIGGRRDSVRLIFDAVDACVDAGTMRGSQRLAIRLVATLTPRRFARHADAVLEQALAEDARATGAKIDPDNLRAILDILIEYLPQLIDILLQLFKVEDR